MMRKQSIAVLLLSAVALPAFAADAPRETFTQRLTPEQYQNVIADVFGPEIGIGGRVEPSPRIDGLMEVGSGKVSVSSSGMEQYEAIARGVADQVTDEKHRDVMIHCKPKAADDADEACARQFLSEVGGLLFRRPLTGDELDLHVQAANAAAREVKSFYAGLSLALAGMLTEPQFLFRDEMVEPDPAHRGSYRLDGYAKAARLSFFLWNSSPDQQLLAAARKGDLDRKSGLAKQVDRMIASPRLEAGIRAFFTDMLHLDELTGLTKDTTIYPKFGSQVAADAREQTLRTIVDLVWRDHGDYRDIFTIKKTYMTKALAAIYKVPFVVDEPNGAPDTWRPYSFAASDPRAGILMQVSFVALNAHPGRSSPTLRGKALREVLLCQKVPAPPGDVKFDIVQDTSNPVYRTARARLDAHRANPVCAGCHRLVDPIGLALENFDGAGDYRTTENGVPIDTSGELDGVKFANAVDLGKAVHDNPATTSCLVDRMSAYALGHAPDKAESAWVEGLKTAFAKDLYAVPDLMRRIALSPQFFSVAPTEVSQ
jgi:hypothetical protein